MSSRGPPSLQCDGIKAVSIDRDTYTQGNHGFDSKSNPAARSLNAAPATAAAAAAQLHLNRRSTEHNSNFHLPFPSAETNSTTPPNQFEHYTNTIISPPLPPTVDPPSGDSTPQRADTGFDDHHAYQPSPLGTGSNPLRIRTDVRPASMARNDSLNSTATLSTSSARSKPAALSLSRKSSASNLKPVTRTPSFKSSAFKHNYGSHSAASSTYPSPVIAAMGDVTPLPSPLLSGDSPGPWSRLHSRPTSREAPPILPTIHSESALVTSNGESISSALANQTKRKAYSGLDKETTEEGGSKSTEKDAGTNKIHTRNRSISEFKLDPMTIPKRMITVSGSHINAPLEPQMRREPNLSEARGLTPIEKPPSPPPSESSITANDSPSTPATVPKDKASRFEYYDARGRKDGKLRRWRAVKVLGQGTFSRVMLATSNLNASDEDELATKPNTGLLTPEPQSHLDRRSLVAVKVCEHGPKGGASEDRVEMSLKRELEIMQTIHHPSLVDLKAWSIEPTRAILVLGYCAGGDLFDVATAHRELLVPSLLRRIFSELVGATRYLHERRIVHRDIKLENVLVNLLPQELADSSINWQTYPHSVITLTDLGLSRRIADDEKLETRCGSDDYAAPEIILGQPYDGRATDAWSLGVLLYALLESRLPFDPAPGVSDPHRMRTRMSHRIARVEWRWVEYAGDDGDHEGDERKFDGKGLLGAMQATEGLLKRARSRWPLEQVANSDWVKNGIAVEGGIKFREEADGEEVS